MPVPDFLGTFKFFVCVVAIMLLLIAVPTLLLSYLQLFLCRKDLKWGRILPIFSGVVSVAVSVLAGAAAPIYVPRITGVSWSWLKPVAALTVLIIKNIPTLVYCLIYRSERKKQSLTDLDRMKIDDLE